MARKQSPEVMLRSEMVGRDQHYLWAYLDEDGNLHIDGQDLGPGTKAVSSDGEYEWFQQIDAGYISQLIELLGGRPGENILEILQRDYSGRNSYELERRLRESGLPVLLHVWSG